MSQASKAMSIAGDYRAQGYDASTALEKAWDDVRGGSNPISEATADISIGTIVILAVGGWLFWYYRKYNRFPWQSAPVTQRRVISKPQVQPKLEPVHPKMDGLIPTDGFADGAPITLISV